MLVRLSIIYSLCIQLQLCIILAVLHTGLKVNVMHITLHFLVQLLVTIVAQYMHLFCDHLLHPFLQKMIKYLLHINEVICIPGIFLLCSTSSCWYFPKTLQNKFYSNLVAQCLAFAVNFFVRTIHYLYFCYTRDFKVVELHIYF